MVVLDLVPEAFVGVLLKVVAVPGVIVATFWCWNDLMEVLL